MMKIKPYNYLNPENDYGIVEMDKSIGRSIGIVIKKLRTEQRITQQTLSERSGLSSKFLGKIERGECCFPSVNSIMKIASALGKSVSDIIEPNEHGKSEIQAEHLRKINILLKENVKNERHLRAIAMMLDVWFEDEEKKS